MIEEVDSFKFFGSIIAKIGGVVEDLIGRVIEGAKVSGALNRLWKVWSLGVNVKITMYERIDLPRGRDMGSKR